MKKIFSRAFRWALALLGISAVACDKNGNFIFGDDPGGSGVVAMYGVPTAEYRIKGNVVDESKTPIKGIIVSHYGNQTETAADGSFNVHQSSVFIGSEKKDTVILNFYDIDGPENGGEFESKSVTVDCKRTSNGDGVWNQGSFESDPITVELKKK